MNIEVRASNVQISEALASHIERKIDFALRRFAGRVERVVVRLVDLNGPKGGPDKRCKMAARLSAPAPSVIVEAIDGDAYAAVSQAASRLDERVARTLARRFTPLAASDHR
jgi:putative sigma-54 modulation protein